MPSPETVAKDWRYSNRHRAGVSLGCGLLATVAGLAFKLRPMAPLVGWDVGALVFVLGTFLTTFRLDAANTDGLASSEPPDRVGVDLTMIFASVASLGAVGMTLIEAGQEQGSDKTVLVVTGVVSVLLSWLLVHTIYALIYARLYYDEPRGGIDFNEETDPDYGDFAYLAFTVGMTYQVSDTDIKDKRIRRAILHQAGLAYLFGTVIVATTINFVAGLGK